jgi:hypothetical protein
MGLLPSQRREYCIRLHGTYKAAAYAVAMVLQIDRDFPALAELVDVRVELCTW